MISNIWCNHLFQGSIPITTSGHTIDNNTIPKPIPLIPHTIHYTMIIPHVVSHSNVFPCQPKPHTNTLYHRHTIFVSHSKVFTYHTNYLYHSLTIDVSHTNFDGYYFKVFIRNKIHCTITKQRKYHL